MKVDLMPGEIELIKTQLKIMLDNESIGNRKIKSTVTKILEKLENE